MTRVRILDHLVLTVRSIPATIKWYERTLGMTHEVFRSDADVTVERHALLFGQSPRQKINLHQLGKEFEPKALNVREGSADLCFLSDDPVEETLKTLKQEGHEILEGGKVVKRTGASGKLNSIYLRDPDGNLIEISNVAQ